MNAKMTSLGFVLIGILFLGMNAQGLEVQSLLDSGFDAEGNLPPELQGQLSLATSEFQQLPPPLQSIFGNQRVKIELERLDGTIEILGIVLQNNQVHTLTRYAPENPTLLVETDETTVRTIGESEDRGSAFLNAVNNGSLRYHGLDLATGSVTAVSGILLWVHSLIVGIAQFLGL